MTVLVVGIVFAGFGAWLTQLRNDRIAEARFEQVSGHALSAIGERLALYGKALRGVRGVIAAVGITEFTSEEFHRYFESRDIDIEYPGLRGYGFIRRVAREDEASFRERARADGDLDFALKQLSPHDGERYVIEFVAPLSRNEAAVGLDVASEDRRRAAADRSMETGQALLSAPITLVQAPAHAGKGFLLFLPVFKPGLATDTPGARRAATIGWAFAPLVIDEILAGVDLPVSTLGLTIRDKEEGDIPFYTSVDQAEAASALTRETALKVYERDWIVTTHSRPALIAELGLPRPAHVGFVVLTLAGLLASLTAMGASSHRTQLAAAAENHRLAVIVASAQDAITAETLDGVITDFNPAAEHLFGISSAEAVGRRAADLMIPADLAAEEQDYLKRAVLGESTPPHASRRTKRDGSQFPVQVSVAPIRSRGGPVIGIATVIRDSTEQVAAEERIRALNATLEGQVAERTAALYDSSALQRAVIANAGFSVITTDLEGTITLFNTTAERMLGYSAAEVVGRMTPAAFHDPVEIARQSVVLSAEFGRPVAPGFDVFAARPGSGQPETREWTYLTRGGDRLPVLLNVSLLRSDDGRNLGYLGIAMDLSERYRHEAEMRAAEAGTWSYDVATGRALFSAECARQHGLPAREIELDVAREWPPLAHPDDVPLVLRDLARAIEQGGNYTTEFRVPLPDGGIRWINARGRVEVDPTGRTVRVIGLTLDITARKQAEIALLEAKAEAERANRAKTDFLASMSHEIRTPLNAVIGFTDLMLASGRLDLVTRHQANLVRSSGAALLTVVNDILDFSKVEAGAIQLVERPFSLLSLLNNCIAIARGSASAKGLDLRLRIDPTLPHWVLGDENRLRQVLLNLLYNAVKFTAAGSVTLDVGQAGDDPDDEIRIRVIDTGIGIPAHKLDRLFLQFSQVDGSIQRDYGGTGLGLAICRRLVSLMGGTITASSETGAGSTFTFTVRMPPAAPQEEGPIVQPERPGRCGRILLVDDSGVNRELAEAVLTSAGHSVQTAADGEAAVAAVKAERFDLVLMDVQMPGMDGMTATRAIRALGSPAAATPVIALTANVLPEQIEAYSAAGMDGHIGKPFHRDQLLNTISLLLPAADAVEDGSHSGLDQDMFQATRRALSAPRFREILGIFFAELGASFDGDPSDADCRTQQRQRAHALRPSAAMMGFRALSSACGAIESFDEGRIEREGTQAFAASIAEVRRLSVDAKNMADGLSL